jgi:hypothetical protein
MLARVKLMQISGNLKAKLTLENNLCKIMNCHVTNGMSFYGFRNLNTSLYADGFQISVEIINFLARNRVFSFRRRNDEK